MVKMFKFNLGEELQDMVSGFKGNVEARTQCLNGCIRYVLQPKVDKEGKFPDACEIDEQQLKKIGKSPLQPDKKKKTIRGGPKRMLSKYS